MKEPKYKYGDVVSFFIVMPGETEKTQFEGYVYIVDRYGTFEQNEEPSYDIFVPHMNTLFKHFREHLVEFVRKPTEIDWQIINAIR